jgi:uncharacterized protein YndB with AHSA1/START domain
MAISRPDGSSMSQSEQGPRSATCGSRFAPGTLDSTITWRLEPENGGTRLHLEQSGFDLDSPLGKKAFEGMSGGWPAVLERIAPAIDTTRKA